MIEELLKREKKFDIIHNHSGWLLFPFVRYFKKAKLITTLHGRLNTKQSQLILNHFKKLNYISISYSQRRYLPSLNYVANVYNGIEVNNFEFDAKPKDYLIFLGRISPEKGVEKAIKIAKLAKKKLKIAAKIDPVDQEYWKKKIKPKIDKKQIIYIGEVGHRRKVQLLKNALALINPISWPEPFGLVMIEAMACGTPVIAPQRASVPEIVVNKKTGFIVNPKNLIISSVRAIKKIDQIDRSQCRKHVEKNFTVEKMVNGYEKAYQKILIR
jgi:glycosyltransferase involved in cell wall biosynthesis